MSVPQAIGFSLLFFITFALVIVIMVFVMLKVMRLSTKAHEKLEKTNPNGIKTAKGINNYGVLALTLGGLTAYRISMDGFIPMLIGWGWIFAGLGLFWKKEWGRLLFVGNAILNILLSLVQTLIMYPAFLSMIADPARQQMNQTMLPLFIIRGLIGCILISGILYFNKPGIKNLFRDMNKEDAARGS